MAWVEKPSIIGIPALSTTLNKLSISFLLFIQHPQQYFHKNILYYREKIVFTTEVS